jgi:hypothetical protein
MKGKGLKIGISVTVLFIMLSVIFVLPSRLQSGYPTHWWAGSISPRYSPAQNASEVSMSTTIPSSPPLRDEKYFLGLSVFDSNGSYDQIGFGALPGNFFDRYGSWNLVYSWTTGSPNNPTYHSYWLGSVLARGNRYTFLISCRSGVVTLAAKLVTLQGAQIVWSLNITTGGNYLIINRTYMGYPDYTDYEEVFSTHSPFGNPAFNFCFYDNYWVSVNTTINKAVWTAFQGNITNRPITAPPPPYVQIDDDVVFVNNN